MHFEKLQMVLGALKEASEELDVKVFTAVNEGLLEVIVIRGDSCGDLLIYLKDIWPMRIGDLKTYTRNILVDTVKSLDKGEECSITID